MKWWSRPGACSAKITCDVRGYVGKDQAVALRFEVRAIEGTVAGTYFSQTVDGDSVLIGRDEEADLVLSDPEVSMRHARVTVQAEGCTLEDLGSHLGTRLNGQRVKAGHPVPLRERDSMGIGPYTVEFAEYLAEWEGQDTRALADSLARQLVKCAVPVREPPHLRVENGPASGTRFALGPGCELRVGRGEKCEILVDDARISRLHATVCNFGNKIYLADSGSTNGSFVDGVRVTGAMRLENGSRVEVGRIRMVLIDPQRRRLDWVAFLEAVQGRFPTHLLPSALLLTAGVAGFVAALLL
jgi:pSer/pThr/pTyr-binding forkhead associated (FHA) protein